jgi:hypothetical protein
MGHGTKVHVANGSLTPVAPGGLVQREMPGQRLFRRVLAVAGCAVILAASAAFASTFTVTNTNDSGAGSLRQAILDANAAPGADTIAFDITGSGVHTIGPLSPLPALTDDAGVTIDGYTQPGSSVNTLAIGDDAVLLVELNGEALGARDSGLSIRSSSNLVRGLVINGFGALGADAGGIFVDSGSDNVISGCFLGTDSRGSLARPNQFGVEIAQIGALFPPPSRTRIGGASPSERNVISGNISAGVIGFGASETLVAGNYIGTDFSGTAALGNGGGGIFLTISSGNVIGGSAAGSGNLISGNASSGIILNAEVVIQGNRIGTNAAGSATVPNTGSGIKCFFGAGVIVGGTVPGAGNLISGNALQGVDLVIPLGARFEGNLIGTDLTGNTPLGNGQEGIRIRSGPDLDPDGAHVSGNVIAFNGAPGVVIGVDAGNGSSGNRISGNSVHDNFGLGIDLGNDGVTPNIACGSGQGPNLLQNAPVLTSAVASGAGTTVRGTLNAAPDSVFHLEFFANASCDPSGHGEGELFLGNGEVTTDASCEGIFEVTLPVAVAPGSFITATATDAAGNTSEFSACQPVSLAALTALSPARVWVGLKNSDDVGLRFDLKAEVLKNGSVIGSGQVDGLSGGGSGFNRALLDQIPLTLFAPVVLSSGDTLSVRLSVRAGATGHRSGTARLWLNDAAADSRFGAMIDGTSVDFYLLEGFILGTSPGPGPKKTIDVFVDRAAGGNPFKPLGTWSKTF